MSQSRQKKIKRAAGRKVVRAVEWITARMPYRMVRFCTPALCRGAMLFLGRHKRVAEESLLTAYGEEMSPGERKALLRRNFLNLGQSVIELIYFCYHLEMISAKMQFAGREHIDGALKQKKGVIALTAHFGNFPLMLLRFAREGYKVNILLRNMRDAKVEEYIAGWMRGLGLNPIFNKPRMKCVHDVLRALGNNELVFILLDQNFGGDGRVFVDFFGKPAATAAGPFVFAQRSGAPVVPVFNRRIKDDLYEIMIEPPMALETGADAGETLFLNLDKATRLIEDYVRRYPWEWGWMHRRWKTRPDNSDKGQVKRLEER